MCWTGHSYHMARSIEIFFSDGTVDVALRHDLVMTPS
jgi:hypothetical protein